MFRILFLLFITIPIIEMGVLIWVGGYVGVLPTLALVVMTAVLGVALLRLQGFLTLNKIQEKLSLGEIPDTELIEGGLLLIGGALLLTPGFVTDALGFMFLLPLSRRFFAKNIIKNSVLQNLSGFRQGQPGGAFDVDMMNSFWSQQTGGSSFNDSEVIDGDFEVDPESDNNKTLH